MTRHQPIPMNSDPNTIAQIAKAPNAPMHPNFTVSSIDIPDFLPRASTSGNSAAGDSNSRSPAAVSFTPGMACTREQNSELVTELPSFLRCARSAHGGMKPETAEGVITIENQNIAGTA